MLCQEYYTSTRSSRSGKEDQANTDNQNKTKDDLLEKAGGNSGVEKISQQAPDNHDGNDPPQAQQHLRGQKLYLAVYPDLQKIRQGKNRLFYDIF